MLRRPTILPVRFVFQVLYEASEFSALPADPGQITGFYLRPDGAVTDERELDYEDIEIRLSTTDVGPNEFDIFFEDNFGADEVSVFDGGVTLITQASGPAGGPKDFDYFYPFETPYDYDPSLGNLLMDVISFGGQSFPQIEDQDSSVPLLYTDDPEGDVGELQPAGLVTQFVFSGGGTLGDFDGSGELDLGDIEMLSAAVRAGDNDVTFDLTGDGLVNNADRTNWVEQQKQTYFGDANLDGEFNSSDFVTVFTSGEYEDEIPENSTWADGDWDGDAEARSSDFVVAFSGGGYEIGPAGRNQAPFQNQPVPRC